MMLFALIFLVAAPQLVQGQVPAMYLGEGFFSNEFSSIDLLLVIGIGIAFVVALFAMVKRVRRAREILSAQPPSPVLKDFKRNTADRAIYLSMSTMWVILAILYLALVPIYGILLGILTFLWTIQLYWFLKLPYMRVTENQIIICRDLEHEPKVCPVGNIQKVVVETWTDIPSKVTLLFPDEEARLDLDLLHRKDREKVVHMLGELVKK